MSAAWPPDPGSSVGAARRSWSTLTATAVVLSGLGMLFAFASGIGLPFSLAGLVCGAIAARRDPASRPWPLVAVIGGAAGAVLSAILLVVVLVAWAPLLPQLMLG